MQLNEIGKLAQHYWIEIPIHFPFVESGNFAIMPNHVHGILIIDKNETAPSVTAVAVETLHCNVSTNTTKIQLSKNKKMANISPKPGTISTIIRSYKSVVSKYAKQIHANFAWQSRFHDHIIRNHQSFEHIQNYITNNPANWKGDYFNS